MSTSTAERKMKLNSKYLSFFIYLSNSACYRFSLSRVNHCSCRRHHLYSMCMKCASTACMCMCEVCAISCVLRYRSIQFDMLYFTSNFRFHTHDFSNWIGLIVSIIELSERSTSQGVRSVLHIIHHIARTSQTHKTYIYILARCKEDSYIVRHTNYYAAQVT